MKQESSSVHCDVRVLAHSGATATGHDLLLNYGRLMKETQGLGSDRLLNWAARGELRFDEAGEEQIWLHLTIDAVLPLTCQRCMEPVDVSMAVRRSFRFVANEEIAQEQDAESEEDLLVLDHEFTLAGLIEDEVLMDLPEVPVHAICPAAPRMVAVDSDFETAAAEKSNPFAVLAKLQKQKPS